MSWPWDELGLPGPAEPEAVKHAYAQRLKEVHPEEDPEGFQRLHRAYQTARRLSANPGFTYPEAYQPDAPLPNDPQPDAQPDYSYLDFDSLLSQEEGYEEPEEDFLEDEYAWNQAVYQPRRPRRSGAWKALALLVALSALAVILNWSFWFPKSTSSKVEETQQWLERTFQVRLVSSRTNENREEDRFLYWMKDDPDVRFQAAWSSDGEYLTNYTNARLFREMQTFAQQWPDYPLWFDQKMTDQTGEGAQGGSPPALFLFQLPLEGAEEFLSALSQKLEELSLTDWYVQQPPEYILAFGHGQAILSSYSSSADGIPSGEELLTFYHEELFSPLLQDLLFQQDMVLWDYLSDENLLWADTGPGMVKGEKGWWITCKGEGRDGKDLTMHYFLREDYAALYCIPAVVLDNLDQGFVLSCIEARKMSCGHEVEVYRIL